MPAPGELDVETVEAVLAEKELEYTSVERRSAP